MKKAIGDSIQIDPDNPWIVDSKGRHRNLTAILDWPESCSDEEEVRNLKNILLLKINYSNLYNIRKPNWTVLWL